MKRLFIPLLIITAALFVSCIDGKLEWWESVNTTKNRSKHASGRNDDSNFEKYMFNKMAELDFWAYYYRIEDYEMESKVDKMDSKEFLKLSENNEITMRDFLPKNLRLFAVNIVSVLLIFFLFIAGIAIRFMEHRHDGFVILVSIVSLYVTTYIIAISVFTKLYDDPSSINIGPALTVIGLILSIPTIFNYDLLGTNYRAPSKMVKLAFGAVLPLAIIGGSCIRVVATYSSYLFLLLMAIYITIVLITSLVSRVKLWKILISVVFKVYLSIGIVLVIYTTMPAMISLISEIFVLVMAFSILTQKSDPEQERIRREQADDEWERKRRLSEEVERHYQIDGRSGDRYRYKGKDYHKENGEWV